MNKFFGYSIVLSLIFFGLTGGVLAQEQETLLIGTINRPPFMIKGDDGSVNGFSIDLWREIAKRNGQKAEFHEFDIFADMITATKDGNVDASIANISITSAREAEMDYSQPIYDSGLQILVAYDRKGISLFRIILESGIVKFVLFALGVLLIIAHMVWFFERGVTDRRHDYFRDDYLGGVWDAFWWAFIIMTMGGFENEVPHKKISRILAIIWIVVSLFFISTLTAKITTALTVSELQSDISSYHDLKGKRVGTSTGPTVRAFMAQEGIRVTKEYDILQELLHDLESGKLDAVVQDAPILQYYASHDGVGKVALVGEVFSPEKYGILFPEGSQHKESVDFVLIGMREDGSYQKLFEKYFGTRTGL